MSTGERLRRARLDASITLERVSEQTKIPLWILQAIECDELSRVPGGAYIRGYIGQFARAVGLDADAVVTSHFGRASLPAVITPDVETKMRPATPRWQIITITVAVLATGYMWRHTWRSPQDVPPPYFFPPPIDAPPPAAPLSDAHPPAAAAEPAPTTPPPPAQPKPGEAAPADSAAGQTLSGPPSPPSPEAGAPFTGPAPAAATSGKEPPSPPVDEHDGDTAAPATPSNPPATAEANPPAPSDVP